MVDLKEQGASLDFLGYTFRYDRDLKGRDQKYLNMFPSEKALKRERAKLPIPRNCLRKPQARVFRRAGCRETRMSGSTRGEWAGISVLALSPTLRVSASKRSLPHGSDPTDPRSRCSTVERCGKLKGIRRAASVKVILDPANLDEGG